jgi:hypothetical protein
LLLVHLKETESPSQGEFPDPRENTSNRIGTGTKSQ